MRSVSDPTRLSIFIGAYFLAIGILLPYWPIWLESRGLDPHQIGLVLAVTFWVKLFSHPLVSAIADATGRVRATLTVLAVLSVLVYAAFGFVDGFWAFAVLSVGVALCFQTIMPIGEALTLAVVKAGGHDYGRIRLWGSITFIAAAFILGMGVERFGPAVIWPALVGCMGLLLISCRLLPKAEARTGKPWSWRDAGALAGRPWFILFVITAGSIQAGHAVYYAFGSITWQRMGFSETAIGSLWTLGVVAEIVLFWFAGRMGRMGSAKILLALGIAGTLIRWPLTPFADTVWLAAPLQILHALTFGAAHLGAMRFLQENAPQGLEATTQAFYYAMVSGVLLGTAMPAAGWIYQTQGAEIAYLSAGALGVIAIAGFVPLFLSGARGRRLGLSVPVDR